MATKVGPAAVSYGIGVQNRYSAFLDDDDGFATPASIIANSKRVAELNKQKAGAANTASSKPNNQSSHNISSNNNNPSGGGKSSAKSASSSKQSDSKGTQQLNDPRRNEAIKRGGQQKQITGPTNHGANNTVQSAPKQQSANHNGNINRYHQNGTATNNKFSRATQSTGPNRVGNNRNSNNHQSGPLNKENSDANQQQGHQGKGFFRQNNQRPIVKRSFNQDDRRGQPINDEASGPVVGQSNEEEKRRRQQKRVLDMKHKDPEKREAKRQQSNQAAQSNAEDGAVASDLASSPGNQGPRGGRVRRQYQDGERPVTDEAGRNLRGGLGMRNRGRRPEGENGVERRENGTRGPRGDRPPRNRNGFGQGSRGSRGDEQGKFGSDKQRPIPNFSDKSDFPSLAS